MTLDLNGLSKKFPVYLLVLHSGIYFKYNEVIASYMNLIHGLGYSKIDSF